MGACWPRLRRSNRRAGRTRSWSLRCLKCDSLSPMRIVCLLAVSAISLLAQLAPPNEAGVTLGHLHYMVSDPDATKKAWVDVFGAVPTKAGALELLKLPGIFVIVGKSN